MTDIQRNALNKAIGVNYSYQGKNIVIDRFKETPSGNTVIFSNERVLCNLYDSEVDGFLESLCEPLTKELSPTQVAIPKTELSVFEPTKENTEVKETLMQALRKVKADPGFIPQAEAICNVVSQIVSVQKTEIQMINLLSKNK